jgi:hypothetical protein
MPLGPGKYGARAEALLREVDADLIVVITVGGAAGGAFDVATVHPVHLLKLPGVLRRCADDIERQQRAGTV